MSKLDNYQFDTHPLFDDEFNKIINRHKCPTLKEDFKRLKFTLVQYLEDLNIGFQLIYVIELRG